MPILPGGESALSLWVFTEKCDGNRAGTGVGADDAAYHGGAQQIGATFPKVAGVFDIFFQQMVRKTGVAQQQRAGEIYPTGLFNLLYQQIVALPGATGFAQHVNFTFPDRKHRLEI